MINNLHSLIAGKWYLEPTMVSSFLPLLQGIFSATPVHVSEQVKVSIVTQSGKVSVEYYDQRTDTIIYPTASEPFVMINPIKTPVYKYSQACGPHGSKHHQQVINKYLNDANCVGVILDIDSPGGQVSGTAEFYDFLNNADKRIETFTDGYLCSAAYYIGSATKKINAHPRVDKIGSIGTMVYTIDLTGYYEKQGAKVITEYATKSTAKNDAWEELLKGNPEKYIKTELDPVTETFIADVKAKRPSVNDAVFDGSTYNAEKALEMGLIDKIGTLGEVIASFFSNKNVSTKINDDMGSGKFTSMMAVLAISELAMTDNGSFLNEEQLHALEETLTQNNAEIERLTAELTTANAKASTTEQSVTNLEEKHGAALDGIMAQIGIAVEGTATEKQAAIAARLEAINKGKSAHAVPKPTPAKEEDEEESIVDPEASHNKLLNNILNS